jgi:hypothetical protein
MFQFTKQGQSIEGTLLTIEPTMVKGKQATEYLMRTGPNARITFLGTNDLDKKLHPGLIGHVLRVRYERDEDFSGRAADQNKMKIFKVEDGGLDEDFGGH